MSIWRLLFELFLSNFMYNNPLTKHRSGSLSLTEYGTWNFKNKKRKIKNLTRSSVLFYFTGNWCLQWVNNTSKFRKKSTCWNILTNLPVECKFPEGKKNHTHTKRLDNQLLGKLAKWNNGLCPTELKWRWCVNITN